MDAEIIGIYGLQGWGKTALTTVFGKIAHDKGFKIYSNYHLSFDYTPVTTLTEAKNARNGYMLFDEFWRWVHARTSQTTINKEMMAICLLNRKRGINIIYNSQLPRTIDVILKDVTNMRILPQMITHKDGKRYIHYWGKDLMNRETGEKVIPVPIDVIGKWFNTREEVGKLEKEITPLENAIIKEKRNVLALNKLKGCKARIIPNSGINSHLKGDIDITTKYGRFVGDTKSTGLIHVTICDSNHRIKDEMNKFLDNAKEWHYYPIILFPKKEKAGKSLNYPANWYIYFLHGNSYLLDNKGKQLRYDKLVKESEILKNWDKKPKYTKI